MRLKKKKGHCYSRAFFLKRKTRRLKIEDLDEHNQPHLKEKWAIFETMIETLINFDNVSSVRNREAVLFDYIKRE